MPVSPNQGSTGGGDAVVLSGHHFTGATDTRFGSRRAAVSTVLGDTTIHAVTPAGSGAVPVTVTTAGGTGVIGTFFYLPPPSTGAATPSAGPVAGGNTVTITGIGLSTTSAVRLGGQDTVFTVVCDGELTVTVPPAAAAGAVAVTVITQGGVGTGATYTYLAAPALTGITPASGPAGGGNLVVITGTALSDTTGVTIGGVPALHYRIASDTEIDVVAPAGVPGPADVSVTTPGSTTTAPGSYTYPAAFAVLAGQTVTNTGPSVVTGDLGVSPGTAVTGFPPGLVNGTTHCADSAALQGQRDLAAAYDTPPACPQAPVSPETSVA